MAVINLNSKFEQFQEFWSPQIVGRLNGQELKLARLKGEFVRHQHENEDEMFLVLEGELLMQYDDRQELIKAGEFVIVPRGVYHQPIAKNEVKVMLFEPQGTLNTGDQEHELTKRDLPLL
jgi:mannose-6-phosphate isomerase-like protein (cupin superfamily)